MNWPVEILELLALQQEVERASGLPGMAGSNGTSATDARLLECERKLGFSLESHHRRFLSFSDGWAGFNGSIDLFSTEDFMSSHKFSEASAWLRDAGDKVLGAHASVRGAFFPIAFCKSATAAFAMKRESGEISPVVYWFGEEPIEDYPSFDEMFASVKEYTRMSIDY